MRLFDSIVSATRSGPARVVFFIAIAGFAAGGLTVALHPWRSGLTAHHTAKPPLAGPGTGEPGAQVRPSGPLPAKSGTAPAAPLAVGQRQLSLSRGRDRPLPTTLWYPAEGSAGSSPRSQVAVAQGKFPVVLLSHGLPSLPETYSAVGIRLAAAGFVVAAPLYPHTNITANMPTMADVPNQPADAYYVIDQVLRLDADSRDPLSGHLDTTRYAAVGHSAGGFTTAGMLTKPHDQRLAAAVIIAGGMLGPWTGPGAEMLFIHGDSDQTISYATGREAYAWVPWPKSLLTVVNGDHKRYLSPGEPGFDPVMATMTDFLRATLYGDGAARWRMADDGAAEGVRYEHAD